MPEFDHLQEETVNEIKQVVQDTVDEQDPWSDQDVITEEKFEERMGDIDGVDEQTAAQISQSYAVGALHHIVNEDCEHEDHAEIRSALGISGEDSQSDDGEGGEDGSSSDGQESNSGDSDGSDGNSDSGGQEEGEEESDSDPWGGQNYQTQEDSPWGG